MLNFSVFVSSTFEDLIEVKQRVFAAILGLGCRPVGMEAFGSSGVPPWEVIRREIDSRDCCVVIIAGRYGVVDHEGTSYREREYAYAVEPGGMR